MKWWVAIAFVLAAMTGTARAQPVRAEHPASVSLGSGWGGLWDDETNLGRGVPLAAGVVVPWGDHLRVSGDVDWTHHVRDSGYLAAKSNLLAGMARGTFIFRQPRASVRPFAGAGLGVVRSSGTLTFQTLPSTAWTLTRAVYDVHGGVRIALTDRIGLRPEYRWRATVGSRRAGSGGLEPPLVNLQALVHVELGL